MTPLLTEKEMMQFTLKAQALIRGAEQAKGRTTMIGLFCACALFCGVVEYAVSYEIFAYLKQPLPGEKASWSIWLFAMTGVLMAVALHLHAHHHPGSPAVLLLRLSVSILVPLYGLGAGAALAAILYFDGADALFQPQATAELFATVTEAASLSPSLISDLAPYLSLIFVFGCGGLGIITLYLTHTLLTLIRTNIQYITERRQDAQEAREALRVIEECDRTFSAISSERQLLAAQNPRAEEVAFANTVVATINKELLGIEQGLVQQQLRLKPPPSRFELREEDETFDLKETQRRIAALRAITPKAVVAAFRDEPDSRSKS